MSRHTILTAAVAPAVLRLSVEDDGQLIKYSAEAMRAVISPVLAGNVSDWAPAGIAGARVVRIGPTGAWGITGIDLAQWPVLERDGIELDLINTSGALGDTVSLFNANGGSVAANQFLCPLQKTYVIPARGRCALWYDTLSAKWRVGYNPRAITATLVVPVPALAAATTGYVDVSTVGTELENIPANSPITVNPQADVQAAALAAGGFWNARVSALSTIRFLFVGVTAGGNVNFTVSWP